MTLETNLSIAAVLISLAVPLIRDCIYPRYIEPKPRVTLIRSSHWTSIEKDEALHDHVFVNEGDAPAKDMGLNFAVDPKFKIKGVESDRPWDRIMGGEEHHVVELNWSELPLGKSFHVLIYTETSPSEKDLYPAMYRAWYKGKTIDEYGTGG